MATSEYVTGMMQEITLKTELVVRCDRTFVARYCFVSESRIFPGNGFGEDPVMVACEDVRSLGWACDKRRTLNDVRTTQRCFHNTHLIHRPDTVQIRVLSSACHWPAQQPAPSPTIISLLIPLTLSPSIQSCGLIGRNATPRTPPRPSKSE